MAVVRATGYHRLLEDSPSRAARGVSAAQQGRYSMSFDTCGAEDAPPLAPPLPAPPDGRASAAREVDWGALTFNDGGLEGFTIGGRYLLTRYAAAVCGSYGLPFEALDSVTGARVFVKLLSSAAATCDKVGRELHTAYTLHAARGAAAEGGPPPHPGFAHLAEVLAVLASTTATRDGVTVTAVPALVFAWYPGGDCHGALFAPPRRTAGLPDRIARHVFGQLVQVRGPLPRRG